MAADEKKEVEAKEDNSDDSIPPMISEPVKAASGPPKESSKSPKEKSPPKFNEHFQSPVGMKRKLVDRFPYLNPKRWSFECIHPGCKEAFEMTNDLYDHIRDHSAELSCPVCGNSYTCMASLVYHARTHTKSKPYICPIPYCKFKTTTKGNLKAHLLSMKHTGEMRLDLLNVILSLDTEKPRPEVRLHGPREKKRKLTRSEMQRMARDQHAIDEFKLPIYRPDQVVQFKMDRNTRLHELKMKQMEEERKEEKASLIQQQQAYNMKIRQEQVKTMYPMLRQNGQSINYFPPRIPAEGKKRAGYFQALSKYQIGLNDQLPPNHDQHRQVPVMSRPFSPNRLNPYLNHRHLHQMSPQRQQALAKRIQYSTPPMPCVPVAPIEADMDTPPMGIYGDAQNLSPISPLKTMVGFEDLNKSDFDDGRKSNATDLSVSGTLNKAVQEFKYIGGTGALYHL